MTTHKYHLDLDVLSAGTLAVIAPVASLACGPRQPPVKQTVIGHRVYVMSKYYYPRDENLHHGRFLFRHKGKRKKGKPNYPPTKLLVKTGRRWSKSKRGCRKLWKAEDRLRGWGRPDPRRKSIVVKVPLETTHLFTRKGPVGNVMVTHESVVQERQT